MIYLDHNATAPVLPEVVEAMLPWLTTHWGNPSSIHGPGRAAREAIEEARTKIASLVRAQPHQLVFTSGATEANNSAIHSALLRDPSKRHIITSAVEHSAVLAYCEFLEYRHAVEITRLPVDSDGRLSCNDLRSAIRSDTALVSLMWANNETGVIWPIKQFAEICFEAGVPLHTDAVQAVGKLPVEFEKCGASFLSLSGHKFGAPKGIGVLIVSDPETFVPLIYGGKQESRMRGGTESVPLIVALGTAAEIVRSCNSDCWKMIGKLRDKFEDMIKAQIPGAKINGIGCDRLLNTSNIYLPGFDGDAIVTYLDQHGIYISSGSACLESSIVPSHVIQAMSGSYERASESIRISFGLSSVKEDLKQIISTISDYGKWVE